MASEDTDLKQYALDSAKIDFYELLGVRPDARENEIRSAWRKTSLKYHPDKFKETPGGLTREQALQRFHDLTKAYDVLSDETVRALYDNARRAIQEKLERDNALQGRRRELRDQLERREREWRNVGSKRARDDEDNDEARLQREIARLAEDGKRRRTELAEKRREEALAEQQEFMERQIPKWTPTTSTVDDDSAFNAQAPIAASGGAHTISFRYPLSERTKHYSSAVIQHEFEVRFGDGIEDVLTKEFKKKVDGQKHRQIFVKVLVSFRTAEKAHSVYRSLRSLTSREQESVQSEEIIEKIFTDADSSMAAFLAILQDLTESSADGNHAEPNVGRSDALAQKSAFSFKPPSKAPENLQSKEGGILARLRAAQERRLEQQRAEAQAA